MGVLAEIGVLRTMKERGIEVEFQGGLHLRL